MVQTFKDNPHLKQAVGHRPYLKWLRESIFSDFNNPQVSDIARFRNEGLLWLHGKREVEAMAGELWAGRQDGWHPGMGTMAYVFGSDTHHLTIPGAIINLYQFPGGWAVSLLDQHQRQRRGPGSTADGISRPQGMSFSRLLRGEKVRKNRLPKYFPYPGNLQEAGSGLGVSCFTAGYLKGQRERAGPQQYYLQSFPSPIWKWKPPMPLSSSFGWRMSCRGMMIFSPLSAALRS